MRYRPSPVFKPAPPWVLDPSDPINMRLAACWILGDTGGPGIAQDISGNGKHAIAENTPTLAPSHRGGLAVGFSSGSTQYLQAPVTAAISPPFAFSCWYKPTNNTGTQCIVSTQSGTGPGGSTADNFGWRFEIESGAVDFIFGRVADYASGISLTAGQWNFLGFSVDKNNGSVKFYVNGSTATVSIGAINNSTAPAITLIGSDMFSEYANGALEGLRVFNRIVSVQEFARLRANPYAGLLDAKKVYALGSVASAGSFQAAWARNANVYLGGGIAA